jgi:hypothetical protein
MKHANRLPSLLLIIVLLAAGITSEARGANPINFGDDGWYSWRVATVGEYAEEEFYVRIKSGKPQEIEIIGHWCHGWKRSRTHYPDATDFGLVDTDLSIDWFQQYIGDRSDLGSDALAAISMHDSDRAVQILIDVVESDAHMDVREEAVFLMAQSESEAAFAYLDRLLMKQ